MWPLPVACGVVVPGGSPSVTQTFPFLSTCIPCGKTNIPAPKLVIRFPDESNLSTAGRFEPPQVFAPHRSATQIDLPSGSISTALVDPHVLPSGIFAQFSTVAYGLGRSLTGWTLSWVYAPPADIASAATMADASVNLTRFECDIGFLL